MNKEDFIKKFASEFEDTDVNVIKQDTFFKDLEEWSSMTVLSVIGMVNKEYQVRLRGEDFRNASTVEDLYNLINGRKNNA
jgi:acyl carrier protein